jgi:peptide/nickel transport system substrate-binding protein
VAQKAPKLVIAVRVELNTLAGKLLAGTGGVGDAHYRRPFNAEFAIIDGRGAVRPYLVEALPQLNTETWRVLPDGRMETTYRLKPGLTWHDGAPLSARDFVFAWRVYATPQFGVAASPPINQMQEVGAADERTVVISWRGPFPGADALVFEDFQALPRHVLEEAFERDTAEAFGGHPFWTTQYVGLGPYRVDRWEPGAFLEAVAFDGHALGRPRIDRIELRVIADSNTILANLLAGEVHASMPFAMYIEQASVLRGQQWDGGIVVVPAGYRKTLVQHRPEYANPRAILDVRVRRALAHALDRQAINDSLLGGEGLLANIGIAPTVDYYPDIDRAIAKYPHDLRRSEQLMAEAGYTKGTDGVYTSRSDGRFSAQLQANATADLARELSIMADQWRQAGFEMSEWPVSLAEARDPQVRSTFPALYTSGGSFGEKGLADFTTVQLSSPENRWRGNNRTGWSNAEFDRLFELFNITLDRSERNQQVVQMAKIFTEELPGISLHHSLAVIARAAALSGPESFVPDTVVTWNIHEWEWR